MALNDYLAATRRLLQNPSSPTNLYSTDDLTANINTARRQLAGEAKCVRVRGTLDIDENSRVYAFSDIDVTAGGAGVDGVYEVRQASVQVGSGESYVAMRNFPWFQQYYLNDVTPDTGRVTDIAQYGQGTTGSLYVYPIPGVSETYTLNLDCVCLPVNLANDSTLEAIPFPWTDAVPFLAAWYAYMQSQRQADANTMYERYEQMLGRARNISTPEVTPHIYPQQADPTIPSKLGLRRAE